MLRPLSVGEILDTSFSLYRRHFGALATVSLVCTGLPLVLRLFVEASGGLFANLTLVLLYFLCLVVLSLVATGATVFIVSESYLGRPLTAREALVRATPHMVRILIASLLMGLVILLGFLLMVIPGVILAVGLAVAIPAVVLEAGRSASGALSRSWELTRGSRWRIFGLGLTLFVLLYIPVVAISGLVAVLVPRGAAAGFGASSTATIVALAIGGVVQLFIYPLFYCVLTVTYYDLRVRKEGFDLELLASSLQTA
ncbi:MAG TPA: glycerophosphoryl diester phosphodiesterase membrane domain-containing protein [Gemmatimonadales bacterium]|nr:glycerophosphoryl diester phosphodiesterase membrane domain-containing protein [Gemmatimonadales bacterium]